MLQIVFISLSALLIVGAIGGGAVLAWRALSDRRPTGACAWCGYSLRGIVMPYRCPECGHVGLRTGMLLGPDPRRRRQLLAGVGSVTIGLAAVVAMLVVPTTPVAVVAPAPAAVRGARRAGARDP